MNAAGALNSHAYSLASIGCVALDVVLLAVLCSALLLVTRYHARRASIVGVLSAWSLCKWFCICAPGPLVLVLLGFRRVGYGENGAAEPIWPLLVFVAGLFVLAYVVAAVLFSVELACALCRTHRRQEVVGDHAVAKRVRAMVDRVPWLYRRVLRANGVSLDEVLDGVLARATGVGEARTGYGQARADTEDD